MKAKLLFKNLLLFFILLFSIESLFAQAPTDIDPTNIFIRNKFNLRYTPNNSVTNQTALRGDMIIIGNNNLSKDKVLPYNVLTGDNANNDINMVDVDIDAPGTGTFNSSSANLLIPNNPQTNPIGCSRIVYAGLYWSGTYKYLTSNTSSSRPNDWNKVKFRTPTGNYIDVTATDILYNGFDDFLTAPQVIKDEIDHSPYSCYADVTNIITAAGANPNGNYFVGNIRATIGLRPFRGGTSAGWSLVIVYENVSLPSKYIATFDGHAIIKSQSQPMDIAVSGFRTLPSPQPVNARIGAMAIEGDERYEEDQLLIKAGTATTFTALTNPGWSGNNNFFNSSISLNNLGYNGTANRNPNSINTLGWDSHLNKITQGATNPIVPNNITSATLQLKTGVDKYDVFFTSFDVEVIQPIITLTKSVRDIINPTLNLNGLPLGVNQGFYYSLKFKNRGNDDAINFTIKDDLPQNVVFPPIGTTILPGNLTLDGVNIPSSEYTFDSVTKTIVFTISPTLVLKNGAEHEIRIYVKTPGSCEEVVDACDTYIRNQAFLTYRGKENSDIVSNNPSYSEYDLCAVNIQSPTNFLVDISLCELEREEILCAGTINLTAPDRYDSYLWSTTNGTIIGANNTQTITVSAIGDYVVYMVAPAPCISVTYTIKVVPFAQALINNPIIPFADNIVNGAIIAADNCPNTNVPLPKIFLCGNSDSTTINLNLAGTTVRWEKLVMPCTPIPLSSCANTNASCTWNPAGTGQTFIANTDGQYRVTITYQNNCFQTFYFNVYKNNFDPSVAKKDVICGVPGSLTITDTPLGYEYSLSPTGPWTDIASVNVIGGLGIGNYIVYIRQKNVTNGCVFQIPRPITNVVAQGSVTKVDKNCNSGFGSITINYSGVSPQLYYQVLQGASVVATFGPTSDISHLFTNLAPNSNPYTVKAWSDTGCPYTDTVLLTPFENITLTALTTKNINCTNGNVLLTSTNGVAPFNYAVYSVGGVLVSPIDYIFQSDPNFVTATPGLYVFLVQDANNCSVLSNQVEVKTEATPVINEVHTNIKCFADSPNGTITLTPGNTAGYTITYSLNGILPYQTENVFTSLSDRTYTIFIKYSTATSECIYEKLITITRPTALTGAATLVQGLSCTILRGEISVAASGGTSPYQYSINGGSTFVPDTSFPNLIANTTGYSIIIRDANLCTFTTNIIPLTTPVAITGISTNNTSTPTCANPTTSFTATVTGGTAPFNFSISPTIASAITVTGNIATFTNVPEGFYTITVKDKNNCDFSVNKNIVGVTNITAINSATSSISCLTSTDGQATFTIGNFANNYSYVFNGQSVVTNQNATTIVKNNLDNGTYTLIVTDLVTGCTALALAIINQPQGQLVLNAPFIQPTCSIGGTVTATGTSGWGGYQYTLTYPDLTTIVGPRDDGFFSNLTQIGQYTISVTDIKGCKVSNQFALTAYVGPSLEFNSASSFCLDATNGSIIGITISGGTTVYQYQVSYNNSAFGALTGISGSSFSYPITTFGNYTIKVIDQNGCPATITKVIAPQLQTSLTLPKSLDCSTTSPNAIIAVQIQGGSPTYQYQVSSDNGITYSALTAVTTNPFNYSVANSGTYKFKIIDQTGCSVVKDIIVPVITNPSINRIDITTPIRCNGEATAAIAVIMNSGFGTGQFQFSLNGGQFQIENTFSQLSADTYTVTVKDANGCIDTETIQIGQPDLITGSIRLDQDLTCDLKGKIVVENVQGGTPAYQYSSNGIDFQPDPIFPNLEAGSYTITIRDSRGCTATTNEIEIKAALKPTDIIQVATPVKCPLLTYSVTVTPVGGVAPYVFQIISPSVINPNTSTTTEATFNNLQQNVLYKIKVKDAKNCVYEEDYFVAPITNITVSGVVNTTIKCLNDNDGKITFTVGGFAGNYSYSINGSSPIIQNNLEIVKTGLVAGDYTIIVKDLLTDCEATITKRVEGPSSQLTLNYPTVQPTCSIGGRVNAEASGGWGTYQYTLIPDVSNTSPNGDGLFTGLLAGTLYTIKVKDLNGCEVSNTFTLNSYIGPRLEINTSSVLCYTVANQSTISVTTFSGTPPYKYQIKTDVGLYSALQAEPSFPNLPPANYTIRVVDNFGCEAFINQSIEPEFLVQTVRTKDLDCSINNAAATIEINITGGLAPYQYQISFNNGVFEAFTPITTNPFIYPTTIAGDYKFLFTDSKGCTFTSSIIKINLPIDPQLNPLTAEDNLCSGDSNGVIIATANTSFGLPPYVITVLNQDTNVSFGEQTTGLPSGNYLVTITDAKSCFSSSTIVIDEPDPMTFDVTTTNIACTITGLNTGQILVSNVAGGTPPYTYHLTNNFNEIFTDVTTTNTSNSFQILNFGIYKVEVSDVNGCPVNEPNIIMASPPNDLDINVSTVTTSCATGGTAVIKVLAPILGNSYLFAILTSNTLPYANLAAYQGPDALTTDTATFTNLTPGVTYTFVVRDLNSGCYYFETALTPIDSPSTLTSTINTIQNVTCVGTSDGNISFTIANWNIGSTSVDYEVFNAQTNITTGFAGNTLVSTPTVNSFGVFNTGSYYILFTENGGANSGCTKTSTTFPIFESSNLLSVSAESTNANCNANSGVITATGHDGTAPYKFILLPDPSSSPSIGDINWTNSNVFDTAITAGNYIVYIKDANNCIKQVSETVGLDVSPTFTTRILDNCASEGDFEIEVTIDNFSTSNPPYSYSIDGESPTIITSSPFIISNLVSGAHTVEIFDINGCGEPLENLFIIPATIGGFQIIKQPGCTSGTNTPSNNGEVLITATNGSNSYTFINTSPAETNTDGVFENLGPGNYTIKIVDNVTNCSKFVDFDLVAPTPVSFTFDKINPKCDGASNGSISVTLPTSNINIPYTYSLSAPSPFVTISGSNPVFNGLKENNYVLTVTSDSGCEKVENIILEAPEPLLVNDPNTYSFLCSATNTVSSITLNGLTVSGGTSPYQYSIDTIRFQPIDEFFVINDTGIPQDITVYVIDANGCTTTFSYPRIFPQVIITDLTDIPTRTLSCETPIQEVVDFTIIGGSGSFSYLVLPNTIDIDVVGNSFTETFTSSGTYYIKIKDKTTLCTFTKNYIVNAVPSATVVATPTDTVTCYNGTDGKLKFEITNYSESYDYTIYKSPSNTIEQATVTGSNPLVNILNLEAGNYYVVIKQNDFPKCELISNIITIGSPTGDLTLTLDQTPNSPCAVTNTGFASGTITAIATGGNGGIQYQLLNSANGIVYAFSNTRNVFPQLADGLYTVQIKDSKNCPKELQITVGLQTSPLIVLSLVDACANDGDFAIQVTRDASGIGPYFYRVDNGPIFEENAAVFTIPNLLGSTTPHKVEIIDNKGCKYSDTVLIRPKAIGTIQILSQPGCVVGGSIKTIVNGGQGPSFIFNLINNNNPTVVIASNGTGEFSGVLLVPGSYSVNVIDANLNTTGSNCITTLITNLDTPKAVEFTLETVKPSCFGGNNGIIKVILDPNFSSNPEYLYTISDGVNTQTQNSPIFNTNIRANVLYTITVTSSRGCEKQDQITLIDKPELQLSGPDTFTFVCDASNGQSTIVLSGLVVGGGTPNYFYSSNGIDFRDDFNFPITDNGINQTIVITVKDQLGCIKTKNYFLNTIQTITSATVSNLKLLTCSSPTEAKIKVDIIGGSGQYNYQIMPSGTIQNVTGNYFEQTFARSGNYTIKIIDRSSGCFILKEVNIIEIEPAIITPQTITNVACNGTNTGVLQFSVAGYTGNYSYEVINNETGLVSLSGNASTINDPLVTVTNRPSGSYYIKIIELQTPGCIETSQVVTIATPDSAVSVNIVQSAPVTCNPLINGSITITNTTGGVGNYSYQLVSMLPTPTILVPFGPMPINNLFNNLPAGTYKVMVQDSNLCPDEETIVLAPASQINAAFSVTNQALSCYRGTNASVTITNVTNGQGNYSYALTYPNGSVVVQTDPVFNNLSAGVGYFITVLDGWDCDINLPTFDITQPQELKASIILNSGITCLDNSPSIKVSASGGTAPYTIVETGQTFSTTIDIDVAMPSNTSQEGVFQYTIRDFRGCPTVMTNDITVYPITPIQLFLDTSNTDLNCFNDTNASISANATGGLGGYKFSLLNAAQQIIRGPQDEGFFAGAILTVGSYFIKVVSEGGCAKMLPFGITSSPIINYQAPSITPVSCWGGNDGKIIINVSGGTPDFEFGITPDSQATSEINIFENLEAGDYEININDGKGCPRILYVRVDEPDPLSNTDPILVQEICDGTNTGSMSFQILGGSQPYKISYENQDNYIPLVGNTVNYSGLSGGENHTVFVRDKFDCDWVVTSVFQTPFVLNTTLNIEKNCPTDTNLRNNKVTVTPTIGSPTRVQYSLDNPNNFQNDNFFQNVTIGIPHIIYIKNGTCNTVTELFTINQPAPLKLIVAESGLNQITATTTGGSIPYTHYFNGTNTGENNVYFYDTSGSILVKVVDNNFCEAEFRIPVTFYDIEIPNFFTPISDGWTPLKIDNFRDIETKVFDRYGREIAILKRGDKWDGNYKNNPLPSGDYWYIVDVKDGTGRTFVGNVTLYR